MSLSRLSFFLDENSKSCLSFFLMNLPLLEHCYLCVFSSTVCLSWGKVTEISQSVFAVIRKWGTQAPFHFHHIFWLYQAFPGFFCPQQLSCKKVKNASFSELALQVEVEGWFPVLSLAWLLGSSVLYFHSGCLLSTPTGKLKWLSTPSISLSFFKLASLFLDMGFYLC